jgi:ubiquinone/menaquinone biosynthesis C-methylase UbiE
VEPGQFSLRPTDLAPKGFFYARTPILLIDTVGVILDTNAACRELLSLDLAGCRGNHYSWLQERIGSRIDGPFIPPQGVASAHFTSLEDDLSPHRVLELETSDLRTVVSECNYNSARFGLVHLRVSEVPCINTESGMCVGSVVSIEITDPPALAAFQRSLDRRLGHEIMWEIYAASYDRILPQLPFYQEVVERHYKTLNNSSISSVLDIGAGTGSVTVRLLRSGKRVTAVDVNRAMVEKMRSKIEATWADRLTIIEDTAENLPHLRGGGFDGVTVLLALFDMDNPIAALVEAQRLLKPGGTLIITEPRARFNVAELMTAAEQALRVNGLLDRLARDWKRIQTVAPLVRDAVQDTQSRKVGVNKQDWHAEAIFDYLKGNGFIGLTFEESHLGNCATVLGYKPA